jgi:YhcH/YjgK/YiaL family protein
MIIDSIKNAYRYFSIHPLFEKAFEHIAQTDLESLEVTRYDLQGDNLKVIVSNKVGMTKAESLSKFECHNKYIDIQFCVSGNEQYGWKSRETCTSEKLPYDAEKDVLFYTDQPDMFFELAAGQFVIFFPTDVHAPMIGDGEIKKMVFKIKA